MSIPGLCECPSLICGVDSITLTHIRGLLRYFQLGVYLPQVRSLTLDKWEPESTALMLALGNGKCYRSPFNPG